MPFFLMSVNARYRWLGDLSHSSVSRLLLGSRALVLSSKLEGGANVISEAIVAGTPVIASRIPGSVGLLGADYPGYYPAGDTRALAAVLTRAEEDKDFLKALHSACDRLRPLFDPARERAALGSLLDEISLSAPKVELG